VSSAKNNSFIRGAALIPLILGTLLSLTMPAFAQKVKEGKQPLDSLTFTNRQFWMSETFADADSIQNIIGNSSAIAAFKAANGTSWHALMDERIGRINLLSGGAIPFIPGAANSLKGEDFGAPCGNATPLMSLRGEGCRRHAERGTGRSSRCPRTNGCRMMPALT